MLRPESCVAHFYLKMLQSKTKLLQRINNTIRYFKKERNANIKRWWPIGRNTNAIFQSDLGFLHNNLVTVKVRRMPSALFGMAMEFDNLKSI